jgi:flagellar hook assembly protein FlgD
MDYRIDFEIVTKSTITEVLNYPNPFSTSTQFIFTLTGSEVPDEFKIQIMTISGKVVREITQAEFGPIRIGRNFSAYKWDGRDEYGDLLGNGVYLYRVFARLNGENIDLRETEASQYFTKSFGKMVLFR